MKLLAAVIAGLAAFIPSVCTADMDALLKKGLISPEVIKTHAAELGLSPEQQQKMGEILSAVAPKAQPMEAALKEEHAKLEELLRKPETTADAASAQLGKVLAIEGELKQIQVRTLVELRNVLSQEQREKAMAMIARGETSPKDKIEQRVRAEAARVKAAFARFGPVVTEALKARAAEIEKMAKEGGMESALKALEKLARDMELDVKEAADKLDFDKANPGNIDFSTLQARLEEVHEKAKQVVSVKVLSKLMEAKEALDKAKANADAEMAGKILSIVEELLKKPAPKN